MNWTRTAAAPADLAWDRRFGGDLRASRRSEIVWVEVGGHAVVGFEFGALTSLFDEPDLVSHGSTHVIAAPPTAYLVVGAGELGLLDVTAGAYDGTWVDLVRAEISEPVTCTLDGGEEVFVAPRSGPMLLALSRLGR